MDAERKKERKKGKGNGETNLGEHKVTLRRDDKRIQSEQKKRARREPEGREERENHPEERKGRREREKVKMRKGPAVETETDREMIEWDQRERQRRQKQAERQEAKFELGDALLSSGRKDLTTSTRIPPTPVPTRNPRRGILAQVFLIQSKSLMYSKSFFSCGLLTCYCFFYYRSCYFQRSPGTH